MYGVKTKIGLALAALAASVAVWAQTSTVTIPAQTIVVPAQTVTLPSQSITLPAQTITVVTSGGGGSSGGGSSGGGSSGGGSSGGGSPPGVSWAYHAGAWNWGGDWSAPTATINYADTVGLPGSKDISYTTNVAFGFWLPYPPILAATSQPGLDTTGYNYLLISVKPAATGQSWSMMAYKYSFVNGVFQGDINAGPGINSIAQYCTPAIAQGVWSACKIPLTVIQAANLTTFYKFILQDQTGKKGSVTYINDVGLSP